MVYHCLISECALNFRVIELKLESLEIERNFQLESRALLGFPFEKLRSLKIGDNYMHEMISHYTFID